MMDLKQVQNCLVWLRYYESVSPGVVHHGFRLGMEMIQEKMLQGLTFPQACLAVDPPMWLSLNQMEKDCACIFWCLGKALTGERHQEDRT